MEAIYRDRTQARTKPRTSYPEDVARWSPGFRSDKLVAGGIFNRAERTRR